MYFWRMKMNRFSSGMPEDHRPSMWSRCVRFTKMAKVCFSMADCDSLEGRGKRRGVHHRMLNNQLVLPFVLAEAHALRVDQPDEDHANHEVHSLRVIE